MGYTFKQKMEICLKREQEPGITQHNLAIWAMNHFGDSKPPAQTTISRILQAKAQYVASRDHELGQIRRRRATNPLLRRILTEWVAQSVWQGIPITNAILQLTANAIWTRLPTRELDGNGIFTKKWSIHFYRNLEVNLRGSPQDILANAFKLPLNKIWRLEDKVDLQAYLVQSINMNHYSPQDIFVIDEFLLFYTLPLDQIFDVSTVDKGLRQASTTSALSLTLMLGCNATGTEKLRPLVVGKYEQFTMSESDFPLHPVPGRPITLSLANVAASSSHGFANRINESFGIQYRSNTNKWITSSMFHDYLRTWDRTLSNGERPRKVLLLLDDSSSHRIMNLKFENIRLCFLENNLRHKNPYSHSVSKFDCLPMNYGIVEEFKVLFRKRQYEHMIKLQQQRSSMSQSCPSSPTPDLTSLGAGMLSQSDYNVPLPLAFEWISHAWGKVSEEVIFLAWRDTRLLSLAGEWPVLDDLSKLPINNLLSLMRDRCTRYDRTAHHTALASTMQCLNVVIPWEVKDLLSLVNERAKVTLDYGSIEEIIGSCVLDTCPTEDEPFTEPVCDGDGNQNMPDLDGNWFGELPQAPSIARPHDENMMLREGSAMLEALLLGPCLSNASESTRRSPDLDPLDTSLLALPGSGPIGVTQSVDPGRSLTSDVSGAMSNATAAPSMDGLPQAQLSSVEMSDRPFGPFTGFSPWNTDPHAKPVQFDTMRHKLIPPTTYLLLGRLKRRASAADTSTLGYKRRQHLQAQNRYGDTAMISPPDPELVLHMPFFAAGTAMDVATSIRTILVSPAISLSAGAVTELKEALVKLELSPSSTSTS